MTIQERRPYSHVPIGGLDVVTAWAGEPISTTAEDLGRKTNGFITRLFESVKAWRDRRVTRKQLSVLSDHMLRDIGIERREVDVINGVATWPEARDLESYLLLERVREPKSRR